MKPHVLLFPVGSHGDFHPFIGLGLALRARGHAVTLVGNGHFRGLVESAGLPFVEQGTDEDYQRLTQHPDLWHPRRAFAFILRDGVARIMRPQYELMAEYAARGPVVAIASCLGFGVRMASEKLGVPLATVHLQPSVLWSDREPPTMPGLPTWPRWLKRALYHFGVRYVIDPLVRQETAAFRAEVGLPPIRRALRWWHSPDLVLGLFPDWYAPPQPDWPANTVTAGFPMWDEGSLGGVSGEVGRFLDEGEPPIVFTPGSANRQAADFFRASAEACGRLGRRGVLLTRFAEQIPDALPAGVRHFDYVPFGSLLGRAAALVHHGGIGTVSQGLRAGVPQLIMPLAHDQPDNAARVKKLGVGDWIVPARFRGAAVAEMLGRLLGSAAVAEACRGVRGRFGEGDPFAAACGAVEGLMAKVTAG